MKQQNNRRIFFVNNVKGNLFVKPVVLDNAVVLRSLEKGLLSKSSLEAARKAIRKIIKKSGYLIIRVNAFMPVTSKPSEVRMGKGKGKISSYVCPVKAGHILFEIKSRDQSAAIKAFQRAAVKLKIRSRIERVSDNFSLKRPIILQ